MRSSRRAIAGVASVLVALSGCMTERPEGPPLWTGPQSPGVRSILEPTWELVWEIGTDDEPLLASPYRLTPAGDLLLWADAFDRAVHAVDADGQVAWRYGSEGEGPLEIGRIAGLAAHDDGSASILDSGNGRVVRISTEGEWISLTPAPPGQWLDMVALSDGELVLAGDDPDEPFVLWNPSVGDEQRFATTWGGFGQISMLQRQGRTISGPDGRWLYGFTVGNGWFPFHGTTQLGYHGRSIDHMDFPAIVSVQSGNRRQSRLSERSPCAVCGGWIAGDTLTVLWGGRSEDANQVLDQYDWSSGDYLRSLRLPHASTDVARLGDLVVLLTASPFPLISAFRMVEPGGP